MTELDRAAADSAQAIEMFARRGGPALPREHRDSRAVGATVPDNLETAYDLDQARRALAQLDATEQPRN